MNIKQIRNRGLNIRERNEVLRRKRNKRKLFVVTEKLRKSGKKKALKTKDIVFKTFDEEKICCCKWYRLYLI